MNYTIYRHPDVEKDLANIAQLIADFAGVASALKKLNQIIEGMQDLADLPHKGTIRDDIAEGLRAIPVARKGVITFFIDEAEKSVFIVSITYAGADWVSGISKRI